jgi:3-hydroxybutyryl-CoA dehydratase
MATTLPSITKTVTQAQLNEYAAASGDRNPLHLDPEFAASTQFGGIIAHGMLTLGFVSQMMLTAFGRDWLESGTLKVRFKGAAYVGDEVETWGNVTKRDSLPSHSLITCAVGLRRCGDGDELISGTATVRTAL